jgi:hypothetical protein
LASEKDSEAFFAFIRVIVDFGLGIWHLSRIETLKVGSWMSVDFGAGVGISNFEIGNLWDEIVARHAPPTG